LASQYAQAEPLGPAPTITTSKMVFDAMSLSFATRRA
jgi:hypothetical protein